MCLVESQDIGLVGTQDMCCVESQDMCFFRNLAFENAAQALPLSPFELEHSALALLLSHLPLENVAQALPSEPLGA